MTNTPPPTHPEVDRETALRMWNDGRTYREIADQFPGVTLWAARWAVKSAAAEGLGQPRRGWYKQPEVPGPLAALWAGPNSCQEQ